MARVYNFSAGPSILPEEVLRKAAQEMLEYGSSGMSVMEMSHRSPVYQEIFDQAGVLLRELMGIPKNYKVLFLQGGASSQFAMVPLNLMSANKKADYINTGVWSKKAITEAKRYGTVRVVASSEDKNFSYIPTLQPSDFSADADYAYMVTNNTIYGTRFSTIPDTGTIPLVADMSSNILSEVYDITRFGMVFAGAQKNIGPAGVTVVVIREDLIGKAMATAPTMFDYAVHAENDSMFNTPPTYNIYVAKLVFEWLKNLGGVSVIQKMNEEKAALIYDFIDNSSLFTSPVNPADRSLMNVPFTLPSDELNKRFTTQAAQLGMVNLEGHRSVGGMRASIYNAMPRAGIEALVAFMKKFELQNR
jgi:phosphoserine aminotransferase